MFFIEFFIEFGCLGSEGFVSERGAQPVRTKQRPVETNMACQIKRLEVMVRFRFGGIGLRLVLKSEV